MADSPLRCCRSACLQVNGVTLIDLPNFGGMALVMLLVGLLAGFVPARRASGVGPIRSLASRGFVRESVVSHLNLGNGRRWRSIMKKICGAFPLGLLVLAMQSCSPPDPPAAEPELVYADHTPAWYEAGRKRATVSPDGAWALYGSGNNLRLIDLARGVEDRDRYASGLDDVRAITFYGRQGLARRGSRGEESGWFVEGDAGLHLSRIPADATPVWSPDVSLVAFTRPGKEGGLFVGPPGTTTRLHLGGVITAWTWAPDGSFVYVLASDIDGIASLVQVSAESYRTDTILEGLDTHPSQDALGISNDGTRLYLALASEGIPDPSIRHSPTADRDQDIYQFDLATGALSALVQGPGDDFWPGVADGYLHWTHNELTQAVVVVPASGGEARVVVEGVQIPYWSPDGGHMAYTFGSARNVDGPLGLDVAMVEVDAEGHAVSEPTPLVVGNHEDFTASFSPDGRWIAYHSHRSDVAVSRYASAGSTDDLYLRRPEAPTKDEVKVTEGGWEIGVADWSPDSRRILYDSWDREEPGVSKPWLITIDEDGNVLTRARIPLPAGVTNTRYEAWSPSGEEFAFITKTGGTEREIWIMSPDGSDARKILDFASTTGGGIDWAMDGRILYAGLADDGRIHIFSVTSDGGETRQITQGPGDFLHPQISPDGRLIAATRIRWVKEVRRMRLR